MQSHQQLPEESPEAPEQQLVGVAPEPEITIAEKVARTEKKIREAEYKILNYGPILDLTELELQNKLNQSKYNKIFSNGSPILTDDPLYYELLIELIKLKKVLRKEEEDAAAFALAEEAKKSWFLRLLKVVKEPYDIGKKLFDIVDDLTTAILRLFAPKAIIDSVGPILAASVGIVLHLCEGINGAWIAHKAIHREPTPSNEREANARVTKIVTGILTASTAVMGVGVGIAALCALAPKVSAGYVLGISGGPVVIAGLMTVIITYSLIRRGERFHEAKKIEAEAKEEYQKKEVGLVRVINSLESNIAIAETRKEWLINRNSTLIKSLQVNRDNDVEKSEYEKNDKEITTLETQLRIDNKQLAEQKDLLTEEKAKYDHSRDERLDAEREVAFTTIELTASLVVLTGTILLSAALLGAATVASFGTVPLGLLVGGAIGGFVIKVFEYVDKKNDNKFTRGIRNFFADLGESIFPSPKPAKQATRAPVPIPASNVAVPPVVQPNVVALKRSNPIIVKSKQDLTNIEGYKRNSMFTPDHNLIPDFRPFKRQAVSCPRSL